MRLLYWIALVAMMALTAGSLAARVTQVEYADFDVFGMQSRQTGPVTVYLHRDGGRFSSGKDDPARNRSTLLESRGLGSVDVPAFTGRDAQWDSLVQCVQTQFTDFSIEITDERPTDGDYVLVSIGGSPELLGLGSTVHGLAPFSGGVQRSAVAYVFTHGRTSPTALCETAAEEVGHVMGLDHSRMCSDVMSYRSCGPKTFRDEGAACGEWSDRECSNGAAQQNSYQLLARRVGLRRGPKPPQPPALRIAERPGPPDDSTFRACVGLQP